MKTFRLVFILVVVMACHTHTIVAQVDRRFLDEIAFATRNGDASGLASFFNNKVELVLPSRSGVFSKEQAEFLVKDFFENYPPISFQLIHHGIRENSTFAIGRYNFNNGQFRLLYLTKTVDNQTLIHQVRVEKQDE